MNLFHNSTKKEKLTTHLNKPISKTAESLLLKTRLSNPSCNLRGTGWNRWEWLCDNPQERVLMPFDTNISNRLVVKDNHRPVIPKLIDQTPILPSPSNEPIKVNIAMAPATPIDPVQQSFATSRDVRQF